ncbi:Kynurenine formamidase [Haloferax larsenii]|uniref:Kynurenine formamidase n=1 Tax=Haloferax larsenii TaxID=302484 RepID=A0A1H7TRS1_HALLR|nr:Kynurenine formamidase [Haloferax larsenii]
MLNNTDSVKFVDLSHTFEDGMPGFRQKNDDGTHTEYTAQVYPFFTHEESREKYEGKAAFEVTEMRFQTSMGTYLDSPYHRHPEGRDISELEIGELVLPGTVVDARGLAGDEELTVEALLQESDLAGTAVLFNFGWDENWGTEQYRSYPYISEAVIEKLIDADVSLVGVDTLNADNHDNPARPAHTRLLDEEIFIVENLCNLDSLIGEPFRFFAVPIKAKDAAAMPIRAFAQLDQ